MTYRLFSACFPKGACDFCMPIFVFRIANSAFVRRIFSLLEDCSSETPDLVGGHLEVMRMSTAITRKAQVARARTLSSSLSLYI